MSERRFTTAWRGLDHGSLPMRLWHKAKKLGVWDPRDLDFTLDREQWQGLAPDEQDVLLRLSALFQAGEESVARDLLPLLGAVALEDRLEDEIYLTSFLFEEAKHVETFGRFFDEVVGGRPDLARFETPSFQVVFGEELPGALGRLRTDPSPIALAEASVTYNMIVEGVLAEAGYHGYYATLSKHGLLPGMQQAAALLKRDEARHIAFGVYLLSRLIAEHGEPVWAAIEARMAALLPPALGVIQEVFAAYATMPFGLRLEEFSDFAVSQFQRRFARLDLARRQSLSEVMASAEEDA